MTPPDAPQLDSTTAAALAYATRLGWAVFPLSPRSKTPLISKAEGGRGFLDATTDPKQLAGWWARCPNANVGVATGQRSGIGVLDVDPRHGGDAALRDLLARHGPLPDTPTALTGGGGQHYYFALAGVCATFDVVPKAITLKADGGYVVAPPSVHPDGPVYAWDVALKPLRAPLASLPAWLRFASERKGPASPLPAVIHKGQRQRLLTSLAGSMRRRGASEPAILAALVQENTRCAPPLPEREVQAIAKSVARYEPATAAPPHFRPLPRVEVEVMR